MPAVSKSQQRLMGMVHAYKKGDLDLKDLSPSLSKKIKSIADGAKRKTGDKRTKTKGISNKDAKHFASTKHKGLPEKVKESVGGGVSLNQETREEYINTILDSTMDDRKDLERMSDDQLEDKYYEILDFLRAHPIDPSAGMEEWRPDEEENERIITKFDKFINEGVNTKREDGFYWVKIKNDDEWTIGKYHNTYEDGSDADSWFVVGSDEPYDDSIFDRIGDFIEYKK